MADSTKPLAPTDRSPSAAFTGCVPRDAWKLPLLGSCGCGSGCGCGCQSGGPCQCGGSCG